MQEQKVMKTPRTVDIDITNACNLRCRYCYHFTSPGDVSKDLPINEWLLFFEELRNASIMDVCIAGGEPFIRDDILDIINGVVKNRMRFSILSNGSLITPEHARAIKATGRCNYIQISIDGASPEAHDVFRGKGSFENAIGAIKLLQQNGIPVTSRVTIHPKNIHELEQIAHLLLVELGLSSFSTNYVGHIGLGSLNAEDVELTTPDLNVAMEIMVRLEGKYPGRIQAAAGPLAEAHMFHEMEEARKQGLNPYKNRGYLVGCGCMWSKIAVRADGVIVPCNMLSQIELGRINKDSLVEIWQNHLELKRLRDRRTIPLSSFEFCRECQWMPYCTGNCPGSGYAVTSDAYKPSHQGCIRRFMETGGELVTPFHSYHLII